MSGHGRDSDATKADYARLASRNYSRSRTTRTKSNVFLRRPHFDVRYSKGLNVGRKISPGKPFSLSKADKSNLLNQIYMHHGRIGDLKIVHSNPQIELEYRCFVDKLDLWEEYTGHSGRNVLISSIKGGPDFAEYCKKGLTASFINFHLRDRNIDGELDEGIPGVTKYADIFPYSHLPYQKPDTVDDYKYYFLDREEISPAVEEEFKGCLRALLKKYVKTPIKPPSEAAILSQMKMSSTYDRHDRYHAVARIKRPTLSPKQDGLVGRRIEVFVGPANERDSVIWDIRSLETISYISFVLWQIVDCIPHSAMTNSREKGLTRERSVMRFRHDWVHYVRDIKKCGLSFPQTLFLFLADVLEEEFPHLNLGCIRSFANISLEFDLDDPDYGLAKGQARTINRGYGLGSASECVTLIQCVIMEMIRRRASIPQDQLKAVAWHDDVLVTVPGEYARRVKKLDEDILNDLGIILKKHTTAVLYGGFVFMEEYGTTRSYATDKEIRDLLSVRSFRYLYNISCAKVALRSLDLDEASETLMKEVESLIDYWGYEFFPEEANLSASLGGWKRSDIMGFDASFIELTEDSDTILPSSKIIRAIQAEKVSLRQIVPKSEKKKFKSLGPSGKIWNGSIAFEKVVTDIKGVDKGLLQWDKEELRRSFLPHLSMRKIPEVVWDLFHRERKRAYKDCVVSPLSDRIDVFNTLAEAISPKIPLVSYDYVEEWTTEHEVIGKYNSFRCPLVEELAREDKILLIANVLQQLDKGDKVICPKLNIPCPELVLDFLEGAVTRLDLDRFVTVRRYKDMDKTLLESSYIPLAVSQVYSEYYGAVPKTLASGIKIPKRRVSPSLYGIELPLDEVYSPPWTNNLSLKVLCKIVSFSPEGQRDDVLRDALRSITGATLQVPEILGKIEDPEAFIDRLAPDAIQEVIRSQTEQKERESVPEIQFNPIPTDTTNIFGNEELNSIYTLEDLTYIEDRNVRQINELIDQVEDDFLRELAASSESEEESDEEEIPAYRDPLLDDNSDEEIVEDYSSDEYCSDVDYG